MDSEDWCRMTWLRHLIICVLLSTVAVPTAHAQRLTINYVFPPDRPTFAAKMHPAAKGAVIGGITGAGCWGGVGVWYCTVGPNEAGECNNAGQWARGMLLWGAIGAGVGALIGALHR
jgi:hypothetical protein